MDNLNRASFEYMRRLDRIIRMTEGVATVQYTALGLCVGCCIILGLIALTLGTDETYEILILLGSMAGGMWGFVFGGWVGSVRARQIMRVIQEMHIQAEIDAQIAMIESKIPQWVRRFVE